MKVPICAFCHQTHDKWICDFYSGAGGAAMGYHRAGFGVIGIDNRPQPHYPFEFHQADVLEFAAGDVFLANFDAIHASPPCQRYVRSGMFDRSKHPDLIHATACLLDQIGLPWVIENVPGAPIRPDFKLCGCMFGLPDLRRERWFETSWRGFDLRQPCHHLRRVMGVYGHPRGRGKGEHLPWGWGTKEDWQRGLGIDWMTSTHELAEAIPPAYTEYIGAMLLDHLKESAA